MPCWHPWRVARWPGRGLASNEENPPGIERGLLRWKRCLSKRRLSYRQLALVDLWVIPRNLTRTSHRTGGIRQRVETKPPVADPVIKGYETTLGLRGLRVERSSGQNWWTVRLNKIEPTRSDRRYVAVVSEWFGVIGWFAANVCPWRHGSTFDARSDRWQVRPQPLRRTNGHRLCRRRRERR